MEPTSAAPAQRSLAAILFTDAVGYSTLAGTDEDLALKTVERDFQLMQNLALRFEGRVVKNTGDGLLMLFGSAAEAVACAIEIQKSLAQQELDDPNGLHLPHRIGIHVGDVMLSENDAKGNGVNVAARLQAEARPGGIWISQTVFDLVKQTLNVNAVALGNKQLRNLPELIGVYELAVDTPRSRPQAALNRKLPFSATAAVISVLLVVVGVLSGYILRQNSEQQAITKDGAVLKLPGSVFMPEIDLSKLKDIGNEFETGATDPKKNLRNPSPRPESPPQTPATEAPVPADEFKEIQKAMPGMSDVPIPPKGFVGAATPDKSGFQAHLDLANKELDYTPLLAWLTMNKATASKADFVAKAVRYGRLENLWRWFEEEFDKATQDEPFVAVTRTAGRNAKFQVWSDTDGAVVLENGQKKSMSLNELPRPILSQMILQAIHRDKTLEPSERALKMSDLKLFVEEFKLSFPTEPPTPH